jgi:hypothetical protein
MVKIHYSVIGPKLVLHFLPGDDLAPGFNQHSEDVKWLLPEKDLAVTVSGSRGEELARTKVNLKFPKPDATRAMILHGNFQPEQEALPGWTNPEYLKGGGLAR